MIIINIIIIIVRSNVYQKLWVSNDTLALSWWVRFWGSQILFIPISGH